jgi:conjugative relaxase-like TrwC/TraI family protein
VRLTVTPIGSTRLNGPRVAAAVVEYLEGDVQSTDGKPTARQLLARPRDDGTDGVVTYYADSIEGPGMWLGRGATRLGLDGLVDREPLERVLSGRHPTSGERLLHAVGSAARSTLAVGTATRLTASGEWLYDRRDAAAALGMTVDEIDRLIATGDRRSETDPAPRWLSASSDANGARWIADGELARFELEASSDDELSPRLAKAAVNGSLSSRAAAETLGVSVQYVRGACRYWERHREEIGALVAVGLSSTRAWIECDRGDDGSYRIREDAVREFVARREAPVARVGFDLTLTCEKSVSVLAMLSTGVRQDLFMSAFDAANATAISYLERWASAGRRQGKRVASEGLVVASYLHGTSRALDPFPHRHNIVANAVIDEHGDRRTIDSRLLHRHAAPAAALATSELRWRLARQLKVDWQRSSRGIWEIAGVPEATIQEFSTRRREIENALAELAAARGLSLSPDAADRAALATRQAKRMPTSRRELLASWRRRARRSGLSRSAIEACFGRSPLVFDQLPVDLEARLFAELLSAGGVTAQHSTFSRGDLIRWIASWTVADQGDDRLVVVSADETLRLADAFLSLDSVVELRGRGDRSGDVIERRDGRRVPSARGEPTFTTVPMLQVEHRIVQSVRAGIGVGVAVVDDADVAGAAARAGLTAEQAELVGRLVTCGDRVACAVGRPGTGKTHSMACAARAWEAAGWRVVGAAVKGEAARHLGHAAGIPSETVAWYLAGVADGRSVLDDRTVLIVDEASTIGDRDMAALIGLVERAGAALRLVGDPAQHGAVPAGGMFRYLCRTFEARTPELRANQRFTSETDQQVAEAVREGQIARALAHLAEAGQLSVVRQGRELYTDMLDRWLSARDRGEPHPMVDRRNKTRLVLNHLAHRVLQQQGHVAGTGVVAADGREFCMGDEVIARRPARDLHPPGAQAAYVRNGSRGVVVAVRLGDNRSDDELDVDFEHAGVVTVPRAFFDAHPDRRGRVDVGLDHAYAITSYAVQGATFATSTSAITAGGRRRELYVNLTRGRSGNHLYAVAGSDPLRGEGHLPRPPRPDPVHEIIEVTSRPDVERPALEIDPDALAVARARSGCTLAELRRMIDGAQEVCDDRRLRILRRAEAAIADAVRRVAVGTPPPDIARRVPPRPIAPWLAEQYDAAVGAVAVYRQRYAPDLRPTSAFAWAVGSRPIDNAQAAEWDAVTALLHEAMTAAGRRALESSDSPLPDPARLRAALQKGHLQQMLASLVRSSPSRGELGR